MPSLSDYDPDIRNDIEQLRNLVNSTELTLSKFIEKVTKTLGQVLATVDPDAQTAALNLMRAMPELKGDVAKVKATIEMLFMIFEADFLVAETESGKPSDWRSSMS